MNKKILSILVVMIIFISMAAQEIRNDIIAVNYEKKNARKAMLFSAIFPGAGQFYANRQSITTYIFPVIEIGLWYGMMHFTKEGQDIENDFEKFADEHYSRTFQNSAQANLILVSENPFYENHFRLDETDTQHFYEDIGKYDKYIFGWLDWTHIYAIFDNSNTDPNTWTWTNPAWIWEENELGLDEWVGNDTINYLSEYYFAEQELYDQNNGRYSGMRAEYISMRRDSRDSYETADLFGFGIVLNHIASAFDALRVTKKYNREYISDNSLKIKLMPVLVQNNISPALIISKRF